MLICDSSNEVPAGVEANGDVMSIDITYWRDCDV